MTAALIDQVRAALATVVVMSTTKPKTEQEWRVALISTVVASIGGGSAAIRYFGLQHWADDVFGLPALVADRGTRPA